PPFDNVAVQYGLAALQAGTITPAQFIDLNQKVGGRTIDYDPSPERVDMPESNWAVTYQGGLYNEGNNMYLPIIDLRGHDVEEIHHDYRSYVMRARLERSNGHHDNQVIWTGAAPLAGDVLKCQLKPIDRNDYATALPPMTNDQFAQLAAIFPSGVCDYSKPGYGQQPTIPWMGYAAGPGGKPL